MQVRGLWNKKENFCSTLCKKKDTVRFFCCHLWSTVVGLSWTGNVWMDRAMGILYESMRLVQNNHTKWFPKQILFHSALKLIGDRFSFQQDNNINHSSKLCWDYLERKSERYFKEIRYSLARAPFSIQLNFFGRTR